METDLSFKLDLPRREDLRLRISSTSFVRDLLCLQVRTESPRTVAPFRNTIDSDDLHLDNTTSNSFVSTVNGSTPNKSLTSLGSRSGLLDSNRTKATASGSATDFDEPQPVRKQRRAPDPYAIDDDDDDALLEELLEKEQNPKPKREEESLMDFLRNAPPPPSSEQTPQPFAISAPASNGLSGASGMKARLLRTSQNSLRTQNAPTKVQSNYSAKVGQERNTGTMPSISNRQTDTGDLADFLRNTGPTPAPNRSSPMGSKAKDGGFSRFFARRKKVEA